MEPTSSAAGGFVIGKGLSALAGLFGGLSVSFFWQPKKLHAHGRLAAGAIIGGIAVSAAFTLGGLIITYFGFDPNHVDAALAIGYLVGVLSVGFVGLLAAFFEKREGKDIVEVGQEIKQIVRPSATRQAPVRRTVKAPVKRVAKKAAK